MHFCAALFVVATAVAQADQEPMQIAGARQRIPAVPVLLGDRGQPLLEIEIDAVGGGAPRRVVGVNIDYGGRAGTRLLQFVQLESDGLVGWNSATHPGGSFLAPVALHEGTNRIVVVGTPSSRAGLDDRIALRCTSIEFDEGPSLVPDVRADSADAQRFGCAVRRGGEDDVHTSRIPALVRSEQGTLIAAFDLRHRSGQDLPGDIDVGVRRSRDGGRTWTATERALDMGEPHGTNGVGDPCLLVDAESGRIWLFALWSPGDTGWNGSRPGLEPAVTGQLIATWSDDDGRSWAPPRNLTRSLKDPEWRLFLQGPGAGITTRDGLLVIPAQYRDADGLPHSTVVWSEDRGETWQVGTGARPDTTESAVVELADGSWMLNMRCNRGGARAVTVTSDRGQTWTEHPSSRKALPDPVCMASLLRFSRDPAGPEGDALLFSNPAVVAPPRREIRLRSSEDEGLHWSAGLLLDERTSAGYSCIAAVDEVTVGILYESSAAQLVFQRVPLAELLER